MSDHIRRAIEEIQGQISERQKEIAGMKQAVNSLCQILKIDLIYPDIEQEDAGVISPARADAYYGKALSTAAREYLEFRKRACSPDEILEGLKQGGFDFEAIGWRGEHRLRSLASSLAKNTAIFRRLPNGMFGLKAWYPDAPVVKRGGKGKAESEAETPPQQPVTPQPEAAQQQTGSDDTETASDINEQGSEEAETGSVGATTEPASVA